MNWSPGLPRFRSRAGRLDVRGLAYGLASSGGQSRVSDLAVRARRRCPGRPRAQAAASVCSLGTALIRAERITVGRAGRARKETVDMQAFVAFLNRLVREEEGQDMVEYALILGLVSIIAVAAVTTTGTSVQSIWNKVSSEVGKAAGVP